MDVLIQVFKNSYSVSVYIIAVHFLISVESQNLRRRSWQKMVELDLEWCLICVRYLMIFF